MRLTKTVAAAFALIAPIGVGLAITAGTAVGADSEEGEFHVEDEFSTDEGYMINRGQADNGPAVIVVTDPDGNIVDPADYGDLPQEATEVLNEVSNDNWQPPDPFGDEGSFGPNGPWQLQDGEQPCYNPAAFEAETDSGWSTTGDEGSFAAEMGSDGEWVQEPVYFTDEIDHELLGEAAMNGNALELDGAQLMEPCQ